MEARQGDVCRVCRSEGTSDKQLYHPCVCTGSIKYIHQECLVQWLKYSKKEYCELCKHRYTFTPIYAPDMPKRLPIRDLVTGLLNGIFRAVRYWVHYTLVAFAWLGIVPLTACRIYRCLFNGSLGSVLTLPLDLLSTDNLLSDCFHGCFIVTCTLCTFISLVWLREQIMHGGGPEWLDVEQPAAAAAENIARPQNNNPQDNNANNAHNVGDIHDDPPAEGGEEHVEPGDEDADEDNDNNGQGQEENNWNPMDWDRAAEDLTWERLLGLDGSLLFLEHVFWVVSLNTLFIMVFAFSPYHIGHFVVVNLHLQEMMIGTHFEGLLTTLAGYIIIAFCLSLLHLLTSFCRWAKAKRVLGLCYVAVKVSLLVVMEIGLFPLICGWWLDICSLSMFEATLKDRENSFRLAPGNSMFIHWLVGMVYIFYFASFILLLREVLRPGVLWFLRNLNDPDFNPIQEMIHLPIVRHFRRFLASMVVFGTIVLVMLWFPVQVVRKLFPSFLPFYVVLSSSDTPVSELSLELLLLQVVLPALLEQGHTRHWLKSMVKAWCVVAAWLLDLRSYLLGDVPLDEPAASTEKEDNTNAANETNEAAAGANHVVAEADNVFAQTNEAAAETNHLVAEADNVFTETNEAAAETSSIYANTENVLAISDNVAEIDCEAGIKINGTMVNTELGIISDMFVGKPDVSELESCDTTPIILDSSFATGGSREFFTATIVKEDMKVLNNDVMASFEDGSSSIDLVNECSEACMAISLCRHSMSDVAEIPASDVTLEITDIVCSLSVKTADVLSVPLSSTSEPIRLGASQHLDNEAGSLTFVCQSSTVEINKVVEEPAADVNAGTAIDLNVLRDEAHVVAAAGINGHIQGLPPGDDAVAEQVILPEQPVQPLEFLAVQAPGLGDMHQAMMQAAGPIGFQPYRRPDLFALRLMCLLVFVCVTLFLASLASLLVPVYIGRQLMSVWTGETKVHELYTVACGLYACWVALRMSMILYTWIPQGWHVILSKVVEWTILVSKSVFVAVVLIGVVPLMLGLIFELVVVMPIRVPLEMTPIFFPWQDWALGVLHAKIITAATMMGPQWRLKRVIEQVYQHGLRNMNLRYIMVELCLPVLVCLGLILAVPHIIAKSVVPALGFDMETQNLVLRRIYPFILGVVLFVTFCIFQARQFWRLYEHIKNDKYLVGQRLVNYERQH